MIKKTARALFEEQTARDIKHHEARIKWLESLPKPNSSQREMLERSREIIKNPYVGYNSGPQE